MLIPLSRAFARLFTGTSSLPALILLAALAGLPAAAEPPSHGGRSVMPSFAAVVQQALPTVVNITVVRSEQDVMDQDQDAAGGSGNRAQPGQSPFDELLRRFFEPFGDEGSGSRVTAQGSGFIIDPTGLIVSSTHVIAGARDITVVLQDNSRYPAEIVGSDELSDLALLRIRTPRPLPTVVWGDSDAVMVGDWVLAVGSPFGLGGTVSAGILSARGRDIHAGPYDNFLQIDAPLNRGNSGGPTFNGAGEVIGINTAIYTPSGGSVGIGFAIPSNDARPIIEQLRARGKIVRGWLGISTQEVTPEIARGFGFTDGGGALVNEVTPGGPADRAGLRQGDIVIGFDDLRTTKSRELALAVAKAPIGHKAKITLWRDGRRMTVSPVISEIPKTSTARTATHRDEDGVSDLLGMRFTMVDDAVRRELGLAANVAGIVVLEIRGDSPFASAGLDRGDVIEEIDRHAVTSAQRAAALLRDAAVNRSHTVLLLINRDGSQRYLAFSPSASDAME